MVWVYPTKDSSWKLGSVLRGVDPFKRWPSGGGHLLPSFTRAHQWLLWMTLQQPGTGRAISGE
jgi:hypothetical protein